MFQICYSGLFSNWKLFFKDLFKNCSGWFEQAPHWDRTEWQIKHISMTNSFITTQTDCSSSFSLDLLYEDIPNSCNACVLFKDLSPIYANPGNIRASFTDLTPPPRAPCDNIIEIHVKLVRSHWFNTIKPQTTSPDCPLLWVQNFIKVVFVAGMLQWIAF